MDHEHTCETSPKALKPQEEQPLEYAAEMVERSYEFAEKAQAHGTPIVGIMCEFTPRELILAAGALPVCLCGGSAETIASAEEFLPANLCPLIKSTFGYHVRNSNPFLRQADLLVAETTCDGKKKMFELMAASKPMYVLELPQKSNDTESLERWVSEVRKLKYYLEQHFEVVISDARLHEAIQWMNRERYLRRQLADLMIDPHPPITGRQLLNLRSLIAGNDRDLEQFELVLQKCRCSGGSGTGAPMQKPIRVLLTGVPLVRGAERVVELIESCGAVVVCMENCTGLKPVLEDVDLAAPDLVRAIAEKYYHLPCSVMTPNRGRFESLQELSQRFRPDCVIELVWHACLTYDVESFKTRKLVEQQLNLPYLKITTDYSPADSARILARVQALVETVQTRL